ncbi:hypothetical protein VE01_05516 [Pseudogymnoascus verrucosus]|uniref:Uncharacterized protein n=1 Tax=Pseudogymnoascus verrucosus TaxID=342668 RepID=A0A1B8GM42_9PEZI|nr:uncharacterized protein VE01_05516 [Pseudogymnoascus verrucosus]OBT96904.1 hypothetical protein VE01_05516 [Pseudogymnoascus verrucosus]
MAPLAQLLALPFLNPATPPINSPRTGGVFGTGPNTTVSYFYPLPPSDPARIAFSTGFWPKDRATVPKTIYECDPPASQGFESRLYTCFNDDIGLTDVVVVPGAEVKEAAKSGEGRIAASKVKADVDMKAPERIRDYQLKKAKEAPKCDGRTGVAVDALHWGAWQHSCFDGSSEWAKRGQEVRAEVLKERAEKGFEINSRIRRMWEEKEEEVRVMEGWKAEKGGKEKAIVEREERFWRESFEVREEGREVDGGVEREFEKRMKGEIWGEVVEEYRSWEKKVDEDQEEEDDCDNCDDCDDDEEEPKRPRHCKPKRPTAQRPKAEKPAAKKPTVENTKAAEKPKEPAKPQQQEHPTLELGKSHYDRPSAMKKGKPAKVKVKQKNGKYKVKVKDGNTKIRLKGKNGKSTVKVEDKAGKTTLVESG